MWFTGKLRASVKANNLHLKCKNGSDCVGSNQIHEKTPRKTESRLFGAEKSVIGHFCTLKA